MGLFAQRSSHLSSSYFQDIVRGTCSTNTCFCSMFNGDGDKQGSQAAAAQRTQEGRDKSLHAEVVKDSSEHRCVAPSTNPRELTHHPPWETSAAGPPDDELCPVVSTVSLV